MPSGWLKCIPITSRQMTWNAFSEVFASSSINDAIEKGDDSFKESDHPFVWTYLWQEISLLTIVTNFWKLFPYYKQNFVYFNYNGYQFMKTILGYKQNFCIHLLCLSLSMVKGWKDGGGGAVVVCVAGIWRCSKISLRRDLRKSSLPPNFGV